MKYMEKRKKKRWMDPEDASGNSVNICLLKSACSVGSKRRGQTHGKYKVKYKYCISLGSCSQKRRTTKKQIVKDFLESQNNHKISGAINKFKKAILN